MSSSKHPTRKSRPRAPHEGEIRLAVSGLRHGHIHMLIEEMLAVEGTKFVGLTDSDPEIASDQATRYGVPAFASTAELLEKARPHVVATAAVNDEKAAIILQCLEVGAHVIADKPLLTTLRDLIKVEAVARRTGRIVSMMLTERFSSRFIAVEALIHQGEIGKPVNCIALRPHQLRIESRPEWMFVRSQYGGILLDLAVHDIDIFRWLLREEAAHVAAFESNMAHPQKPDFADHGVAMLTYPSGATGLVRVDWLMPAASPYDCRLIVIGTEGTIESRSSGDPLVPGGPQVILTTNKKPPHLVPLSPPAKTLSQDLLDAIRTGGEPLLSTEEVIKTMRTTLRAKLAAEHARR